MAKFCKFCGSPLEEGQVCACQSAQAAEAPVATAEAPAAAPAAGNALLGSLKAALVGYWKSPKAAAASVAADKNGMAVAGIFAGVNFLAIFFYIWRVLAMLPSVIGDLMEGMMSGLGGMMGNAMEDLEFEYPIFPMLVSGIVIAAVGIALSALVVFVIAKLNKQEADIKKLLVTESVNTLPSSILLLVGLILGFIAWQAQLIVLGVILVLWLINVCENIRTIAGAEATQTGKALCIQTAVVFVALAVAVFAIDKLFGWCFGELSIDGMSIADAMDAMGSLGDLF